MSVRFAPSPTGRIHVGNLRTAWVSHRFSRALGMPWVVRFEDIDAPRVVSGAKERQLEDLRALGMTPDRILIQSERHARHEELFREAVATEQAYPCTCSRKELLQDLQSIASAPHGDTPIYSGHCRDPKTRAASTHPTIAWRFKNPSDRDGRCDFIIARTRADGSEFVPAYHWACAIDDFDGTHALLVRASDLKQAAPFQEQVFFWVAKSEGKSTPYPAVFHPALVTANDGSRLEKRTRGISLDEILEARISADELVRRFERSFDSGLLAQFSPGKIWGEAREKIDLRELGIESDCGMIS